jgi:hypothetical protein
MKNKKLTYLLIFIVLVVWGLILHRVFAATSGNEDEGLPLAVTPAKEAYNDFEIPKDTTRLLLNYRDPFGLVKFKDTVALKTVVHKDLIRLKVIPAINWNFIQYSGYIRNPSSKKLIALLTINGKNEMLSEGETIDQVKLIKNLRDSIRVSFNGKTKYILLKSSAL